MGATELLIFQHLKKKNSAHFLLTQRYERINLFQQFDTYAKASTTHEPIAKEWWWWWWWVGIATEHPVPESIPVGSTAHAALGALLGPVTTASASVALLWITHSRPLSHATGGDLNLHWLAIDHLAVKLFDGVVYVARGFKVDEAVVADDVTLDDRAELGEELAHLRSLGVIGEIADEDLGRGGVGALAALGGLAFDGLAVNKSAVQVLDGVSASLLIFHVLF